MTTSALPSPDDTRYRPLEAARAMRELLRNREDTRQVFLLMDALRGKTTVRQLAQFRQTEIGRRVLGERRRLLERLCDRNSLAQLPPGTLGHAYDAFMAEENLSAEGLVEASRIRATPAAADDITLFRERNREMHDLLHLVTGYGRDPLGEACVVAFSYAQTTHKGFAVIAFFAGLNIAKKLRGLPVKRAVWEAYRRGKKSDWLIGADWEHLLSQPVAEIRAQYKVPAMTWYPKVLEAARDRLRAGIGQPGPVMASN